MVEPQPQQINVTNAQIRGQRQNWSKLARKTGRYMLAMGLSVGSGSAIAQADPKHKTQDTFVAVKAEHFQRGRATINRFLDKESIIMATEVLKLSAVKNPDEISYSRKLSSTMEEIEIDITSTAAPGFNAGQHPVWRLQAVFNTGPEGQIKPDNVHAINLETEYSEDCLIKGPDPRIRGFRPAANSFSVVGYNGAKYPVRLVVASDDPKPKEQFMTLTDSEAAVRTDLHFIHSAMRQAPVDNIPIPFQPKPGVVNPVVLG